MAIYSRTLKGQAVALNKDSTLPRKLRTLLIAIDGRTRTEAYVSSLSAFGDVETLLESLHQSGLIELIDTDHGGNEPPARTRPRVAERVDPFAPTTGSPSAEPWERTLVMSGFAQTASSRDNDSRGFTGFEPTRDPQAEAPVASPPVASPSVYGRPEPSRRPSLVNPMAHYQLKMAVGLMSDFVGRHLPAESIEIVLELERLTSVEQLLGSLGGYGAMLSGIGEPARLHLAELRSALSSQV